MPSWEEVSIGIFIGSINCKKGMTCQRTLEQPCVTIHDTGVDYCGETRARMGASKRRSVDSVILYRIRALGPETPTGNEIVLLIIFMNEWMIVRAWDNFTANNDLICITVSVYSNNQVIVLFSMFPRNTWLSWAQTWVHTLLGRKKHIISCRVEHN